MGEFIYHVKDHEGKDIRGVQEADDVTRLVGLLRDKGFHIISVEPIREKKSLFAGKGFTRKRRKIKLDDLVVFSRQIATMVDAGVPLLQALTILGEQMDNANFQDVILKIRDDIEGGKKFSEALSKFPKVFSKLFVNLARAGEESGNLHEILDRIANYYERMSSLRKKVRSAMIYPAVVSVMAMVITTLMLTFVIPKFAEIFAQLQAPLPKLTLFLIEFSQFVRDNFWFIVLGFVIFFIVFTRFIATNPGRYWFDGVKLKLIIFGPLFLKVAISRFARTLSTLVKSGVHILTALEIVAKSAGNVRIEKIVNEVEVSIKEGETIAGPLSKTKLFPPMVVRMIAVGEETGELEQMLNKIADFYDEQVSAAVNGLTSIIEPVIIAFLGVVIGGIVIALFLPILTITQHL
ncbi:MAG: type II secretion system F family protein [Candidatus Omnitrophica bacterium]|nr:type II secretion system F family protein [Candidatus Omnitrophota bacterium]